MKKNLLFIASLFILSQSFGQGLYVKFGGGYAIPMGSQSLFEPVTYTTTQSGKNTIETSTTKTIKGSYGAGLVFNGSVGYKFSPFIGLDLNLSYQLGKEFIGTTSSTGETTQATLEQKTKSTGFYASPALMFMAGTEGVRPYALVGVIVGSAKLTDENSVQITGGNDRPIEAHNKTESKGEMAFGFRGGIGVDVKLSPMFALYAEGIFNSMSYYKKESEIISSTLMGDDRLPDFTVRQIKTVYVKELTTTTIDGNAVAPKDTEPKQVLRSPSPLSSLGINIGLKIKLGSD